MGKGEDEHRFDIIMKEDRNDVYALGFFSFYETTELFQLRTLQQLFHQGKTDHSGPLMMGMDCLRVSKFMEAKKWFEKAIKEHIDDYRPQLAMAILYLEQSKPEQALSFLKKALSLSVNTYQKRHIYLLIARLYETSGTLPYAQREIEQVRSLFHH